MARPRCISCGDRHDPGPDRMFICSTCERDSKRKEPESESDYAVVRHFDEDKSYGFLTTAGGSVFVHISGVIGYRTPKAGEKVSYKLRETPKGLQAVDVRVIE